MSICYHYLFLNLTKKQQEGSIKIEKAGVQKILVYPKIEASKATKNSYEFKGLDYGQ